MTGPVLWLEGLGLLASEVGARAVVLARLQYHCARNDAARRLVIPPAFALGRAVCARLCAARRGDGSLPAKLPPDLQHELSSALRALGGTCAVRRSPYALEHSGDWPIIHGGRPERETYLNVADVAEVFEAMRRIWGGLEPQVAIVVQRFVPSEISAVVRRDGADPSVLQVTATLGVGDLLAAGLVVPDRHTLRKTDGAVLASSLGRKAQMTVARPDSGVVRVPVPSPEARRFAATAAQLGALAEIWHIAEDLIGSMAQLSLSWSAGRWVVTGVVPAVAELQEAILG